MARGFVIWSFFIFFSFNVKAQVNLNLRSKVISTTSATLQLDSLSLVPESISVWYVGTNLKVDSNLYVIDFAKALFTWKGNNKIDIKINYRVFPILFAKNYFHKDYKLIEQQPINNKNIFTYKPESSNQTLFSLKGLNKSGSISRGIMFGNNQDLSVNSNMVLQLSGKISNNIEILAAISDDNLPIQPEGNTQQLNEFDRVFIQLKRDSTTLTAGDFELRRPNSYFMNFYKRTQGAMISHNFKTKTGIRYSTTIAAAVAKGRSARNTFIGVEGNQGPYRLTGNNAETFIVVIAGSERVYIDGVLMLRGQDNDYVIDYNTSEIKFTAKQLITQNSRISVEFEYTDKNYARSLTYLNQQVDLSKFSFRLNYYNEKDNRNQPFLQTLSDTQKQFLADLGTNISQAYHPNVTEVEFNTNEILYEKLTAGNGDVYYKYSTDPLLAKYRVGFAYVGENRGNYLPNIASTANGKVYEYYTPVNGVQQGSYEPITLLVTPKQLQLVTFATDYKPKANSLLSAELALSNNNQNLFASKSVANVIGYGLRLKAENNLPLSARKKEALILKSYGNYEFTTKNFTPIERYRSVEFNRDFNLDAVLLPADEHLISSNFQLYQSNAKNIGYAFNAFIRKENYEGFQHKMATTYQFGKINLRYDGSLLNSSSTLNRGNFYKQYLDVNSPIWKVVLGFNYDQQYNSTKDKTSGNLIGNSFSYNVYKIYIQNQTNQQNKFRLDYSIRKDELPRIDLLLHSSSSQTVNATVDLSKNTNSMLSLTAGYRATAYKNSFSNVNEDQNLLGRIDYNLNAFKGFLQTSIYYEIGNGQEPKRDITYLEVVAGQGIYAWNDYNGNGIKELNEFEVSRFPDQAKYIRIFTSTTEFVRTNFTGVNQTIRLQPNVLLGNKTRLNRFLSRFTDQLSYKVDRKILASNGWEAYNPFDTQIDASNLISLSSFFRNTLFFNRNNPVYGIDFNYLVDGGKIFLSNGFDQRNRNEYGLRFRVNPITNTNINFYINNGRKNYSSELFTQRNYFINYLELLPEVNYQINTNIRLTFAGVYGKQKNRAEFGGEENTNLTFTTETRYNILKKGLLTGKLSFIKNDFTGNSNSTIGYEMLSGLQTGNNFTWGLGLQRNIGAGVQLNLSYEGRKSTDVSTVHIGNMQVRAFF